MAVVRERKRQAFRSESTGLARVPRAYGQNQLYGPPTAEHRLPGVVLICVAFDH